MEGEKLAQVMGKIFSSSLALLLRVFSILEAVI
jgi:hypothetical protein